MDIKQSEQTEIETKKAIRNKFVEGGVSIIGAFVGYYIINYQEQVNGSITINWIGAILYKLGGKFFLSAIFFLFGIYRTYEGVSDFRKFKAKEIK